MTTQQRDQFNSQIWQAIDGIQAAITALECLPRTIDGTHLRLLRKMEMLLKNELKTTSDG